MPVLPAARPNLPSAVASEDKEKRQSVLPLAMHALFALPAAVQSDDFLWHLGKIAAKPTSQIALPTKHKKAGGGKTASLRRARRKLLDFSLRARFFQLLLGFFSSSLRHRFLD